MSDKVQLIKKEIERRFDDNMKASEQYTEKSKSRALFTSAAKEDYDLLAFIDSLPEEPKCIYNRTLEERKKFCKYCSAACSVRIEEEPASEDLEEAARHYLLNTHTSPLNNILHQADLKVEMQYHKDIEDAYKAGAEEYKQHMKETLQTEYEKGRFDMREEMMKDAVETTIVNDWQYGKDPDHAIIPAIHQRIEVFNVGDKVEIIIVKTEQQ